MNATFTWTVNQMTVAPQLDGETDVVIDASWTCQGTQDNSGIAVNANVFNSTHFTLDSSSNFTPYDQLTQDQVLGWIWASGISKSDTEKKVQELIDADIARPKTSPPLPWIQPVPAP